ncbi:undecaprenyl-diphosphatase [Candidatus Brocadiaceae bacterium]|nr:undecaprenyl-diphosphatase [Candidatus Brocadiaceae bacterium]
MIDFLWQIELALFYAVNHGLSHPWLDAFFAFITDVRHWFPVYGIAFGWLAIKGGKKGRIAAVIAILVVVACDQLGNVLKDLTMRPRPGEGLADAFNPLGLEFKNTKSFPSNHALNNFGIAVFFSGLYKKWAPVLFTAAALVALSRVYLGLHYPSDITAGALLGSGIGYLFVLLHRKAMDFRR